MELRKSGAVHHFRNEDNSNYNDFNSFQIDLYVS